MYIYLMFASFLLPFYLMAEEHFRVVDADRQENGIECEIRKRAVDNEELIVSKSDKQGYTLIPIECEFLETIIVTAKFNTHYRKEIECPIKNKTILMSSIYLVENLRVNADNRFQLKDYGSAALAYSDASSRVSHYDVNLAKELQKNTYLSIGKHLNVDQSYVYDPLQKKDVMPQRYLYKSLWQAIYINKVTS